MSRTYEALQKSRESSNKAELEIRAGKKQIKVFDPDEKKVPDAVTPGIMPTWQAVDLKETNEIGQLAQRIERLSLKKERKIFHFASCRSGEGTSTIMANLIGHIMDKKILGNVLFIDANLKNPAFHLAFNLNLSPGLCEVLKKEANQQDVIYRIASSKIYLIPAGFAASAEISSLVQNNLSEFIDAIREEYDHILIESAPIFTSPDALAVAICSDITSLVVQAGRTEWEIVEKAFRILKENECDLEGIILNRVRHVIPEWIYNRI